MAGGTTPTPTVVKKSVSVYPVQEAWVQKQVEAEKERTGLPSSFSTFIQKLIDKERKAEQEKGGK